jgi:hypothetical protein
LILASESSVPLVVAVLLDWLVVLLDDELTELLLVWSAALATPLKSGKTSMTLRTLISQNLKNFFIIVIIPPSKIQRSLVYNAFVYLFNNDGFFSFNFNFT